MATRARFFSEISSFGRIFEVSFAAFLVVLAFGIFDFTIPYFINDISTNMAVIGFTVSLIYIASFIFEVPLGLAVDKFGRRNVLFVSLASLVLIGLVYFFVQNILHLMALEFLFGIAAVAFWIPAAVLVRDYSPRKKFGEAQGVYLTFSQLGWIAGPIIAGIVATILAPKYNFLIFSGFIFFAFLYGLIVLNGRKIKIKPKQAKEERRVARLFALKTSFKEYIFIHRHALPLYFLSIFLNIWIGVEWVFVQIAGSNVFNMSEEAVGIILGAMMAVEGLLYFSSGYIMDKVGPKYIILSGFLLLFSSAYFAFLSVSAPMFIFFLLLSAGSVAWIYPGTEAIATEIIPAKKRGEMTGVFDSSKDLGLIFGPLVGGVVAQTFLNPMLPFFYVAVISAVAVFISLKLWK
ncbi:MAG: MFS transporter [DPANN group archaeon]|nr:MFS transporter [DPANN group archaeon]